MELDSEPSIDTETIDSLSKEHRLDYRVRTSSRSLVHNS